MTDRYRQRAAELDVYAHRLNMAHRAALAAREAELHPDADGGGVVLHAEMAPPAVCTKCGGLDRPPDQRPENCPHCTARYLAR